MGTGSGTEEGQSLIRTVPAGACPHFHDAASPVRRQWRTGTPCRAGWEPSHSSSPPLKIDGSERDPRLSYSTEMALCLQDLNRDLSLLREGWNHENLNNTDDNRRKPPIDYSPARRCSSGPAEVVVILNPLAEGVDLKTRGWTEREATETHARLKSFEADWEAPGMEAYDVL